MKILFTLLLLIVAIPALSACNGSARVTDDNGNTIEVERDANNNHSRFCPPGQAKKGHC